MSRKLIILVVILAALFIGAVVWKYILLGGIDLAKADSEVLDRT